MSTSPSRQIPVNLIAGPLGVGKTTAINHLLQHRPPDEQWAVLVNEYGLVGVDAALMEGGDAPAGVDIREVAGGCICCSASFMFEVSLVLLLQRKPDRLLIEPTGLATLSGILDTLGREGIRASVDLRSVVCLLDPADLQQALLRDEVRDQVEAADVVLATRGDLASADQLTAFDTWAEGLFPAKRHVGAVEHGRLPPALLDLVRGRERGTQASGPGSRTTVNDHGRHDHEGHQPTQARDASPTPDEATPIVRQTYEAPLASTIGWTCWASLVFDEDRVAAWLSRLASRAGARRVKAVLRTTGGWQRFNASPGVHEIGQSGYRRDSRLELVFDGSALPDVESLEHELRACLSASNAPSSATDRRVPRASESHP